mmetsp:Transcript_55708/g.147153  ORF Transcript_55708/g.147153 Transcript_55708/m.147153 type:complete len:85 (+) Transcript_55708:68-322(+)
MLWLEEKSEKLSNSGSGSLEKKLKLKEKEEELSGKEELEEEKKKDFAACAAEANLAISLRLEYVQHASHLSRNWRLVGLPAWRR